MLVLTKMVMSIFTYVKRNKFLFLIMLFGVLVLGFTLFYRHFFVNNLLIGSESFYNLRMASTPFLTHDSLIVSNPVVYGERAWFLVLAPAPLILSWILPFLLGIGSLLLFYLILSRLKREIRFIASILLIVSPAFIYLFTTSNKYAAAIFFILLSAFLFLKKRYNLATFFLIFASLFSFIVGLLAFLFLLTRKTYLRKLKSHLIVAGIILLGVFFAYYYPIFSGFNLFYPFDFNFLTMVTKIFVDLGATTGFALFMLILVVFGIFHEYQAEYRYLAITLILLVLLILSVYLLPILFILNILLVYFAAIGVIYFYNYEWKFDIIKTLMILVLVCGLLFSFLAYEEKLKTSYPTKSIGKAMSTLSYEKENIIVISSAENSAFINYAGARTLVDLNSQYLPELDERLVDIDKFYHYTRVEDITRFMRYYNSSHIWIDNQMYNQIWEGEESGILYFFKYGDAMFFQTFTGQDIQVWELINKENFFKSL